MQKNILSRQRPHEQGQTIILVAISLVSLLAMAALAIDIVTLYVARTEIQRAADATALAGAKAIADSGFTSLPATDSHYIDGSAKALALLMATNSINAATLATPPINLVAGGQPLVVGSPTFDFTTHPGSYQVTVGLKASNLPTFFSKIWSRSTASVTATATAEAYNPANVPNFTPIAPKAVKPWLVANADPNNPGNPFINTATGAVETGVITVIGEPLSLKSDCFGLAAPCVLSDNPPKAIGGLLHEVEYVPALIIPNAGSNVCPPCAGATDYEQSIECADVTTSYTVLSCGGGAANAQWDNSVNPGGPGGLSDLGAECLIHATGRGGGKNQDTLDSGLWPASPMQITAGSGPQDGKLVTTSSSIVTIPIIDTNFPPLGFPLSGQPLTVVGFLQAFITEVNDVGNPDQRGDIQITVLNIAGCSSTSTNSGVTPIVGGSGSSPVPVRLITPP